MPPVFTTARFLFPSYFAYVFFFIFVHFWIGSFLDQISTIERSLQGSPFTGSDPTRRSLTPPGHALMASAHYTLSLTTPSSLALERSKRPNRPIYHRRPLSLYAGAYA